MQLNDRTVFITGAGADIGRVTAERCAEEGGAVVIDVDANGGYSAW
jgi:NAD(P)-dependent dehydrogenase (short-subunit alcohol dehydrogenase family)